MSGAVTFSIEIELGWGVHDLTSTRKFEHLSEGRVKETERLNQLLELCDDCSIPMSFDVVGHLFHEECTGVHDGPHEADWFASDPGTGRDVDPLFYAPDLIDAIVEADVEHEICTHTYSHILADETRPEVLDWELRKCSHLHEQQGLNPPTSIVMPRNRQPYRDVLSEHAITALRTPDDDYPVEKSKIKRFLWHFRRTPPIEWPGIEGGITNIACSSATSLTAPIIARGQAPPSFHFRLVPLPIRRWIHRRMLDRCLNETIRKDSHVHLWTHLYDLANDTQWSTARDFIEAVGREKRQGNIDVHTMQGMSEQIRSTQ